MSFNSQLCDGTLFQGAHRQNVVEFDIAYKGSNQTRHPLWHIIGNGKRCHQNNDPLVPDGFKYCFGTESKDKGDTFNADASLETKYRYVVKRDVVYGKTQYRGP